MATILPLLLCLMIIAVLALQISAGMWSNAITFINTVMAALLAMNYFEPLAAWFDDQMPWMTYSADFLALWILFIAFTVVLRTITGRASKVKVRFLEVADKIGGGVFALLTGLVLVGFTLTTLHTAPLSVNFLFGGFKPSEPMLFFLDPDLKWLGFVQQQSHGSFSRAVEGEERARYGAQEEVAVFDSGNRFVANYIVRRTAVEKSVDLGLGAHPPEGKLPPR